MVNNVQTHLNCFCYRDGAVSVFDLRELPKGTTEKVRLSTQEIIYVLGGRVKVTMENNGMSRSLATDEFIFAPVGSRILYEAHSKSTILCARLVGDVPECHTFRINRVSEEAVKYKDIYAFKANERVKHFILGLMDTLNDGLKCKMYTEMEVSRLLFLLHAYYTQEECNKFFASVISPDVKFSEFVRSNFLKHKNIVDLAAAMNMSRQQFSARFKKVFGINPLQWVQAERAQLIYQEICRSDKPLKEIAYEYDFSLQSNFIRFCKQNYGRSPGEIRKSLIK